MTLSAHNLPLPLAGRGRGGGTAASEPHTPILQAQRCEPAATPTPTPPRKGEGASPCRES